MLYTKPVQFDISLTLSIHPNRLRHIDQAIYDTAVENLPPCRADYGYIINIIDVHRVGVFNINHTTGWLETNVDVKLNALLPKADDTFYCTIFGITPDGIFTNYNKLQIIIPKLNLPEDWVINDNILKNGEDVYAVGDWISVQVFAVQYALGNYRCMGKIA